MAEDRHDLVRPSSPSHHRCPRPRSPSAGGWSRAAPSRARGERQNREMAGVPRPHLSACPKRTARADPCEPTPSGPVNAGHPEPRARNSRILSERPPCALGREPSFATGRRGSGGHLPVDLRAAPIAVNGSGGEAGDPARRGGVEPFAVAGEAIRCSCWGSEVRLPPEECGKLAERGPDRHRHGDGNAGHVSIPDIPSESPFMEN